ncbi:MAG: tRNA (adenosine(37)-N6)-dimethylallyltransferase MiaA [Prolixibacteraceae bacterium]|nr:tRNA (adenosine(37)-N6)-dimethylallyltransferase MiaA [Prolixibacteraceae bacterium]MBN2650542.1 tRNA (adenosine(37)-N6)-dimethylallyltransferase MiaA [Prolixibacteraceae bacterium]
MKKTLIVVLGPTGIGKTDLSIDIALKFNTEIISADSRQIFKEMDIGTATPNSQQLHTVKHHFIKSHSIFNEYSAAKYEEEAIAKLDELFALHNQVIMTGGSMLYIDAVCNGIDDIPNVDKKIRSELIDRFQKNGLEELRLELKKIDPEYYHEADLKNHKRIIHALEIFYSSGKKYSSMLTKPRKKRKFDILKIGLNTNRYLLHERINLRVDKMIESGLLDEARHLYPHRELNSLNTVGYKELFDYFDKRISLDKAIELIKRNSRRYARRQITWFRKDKDIRWFEPDEKELIMDYINNNIQ